MQFRGGGIAMLPQVAVAIVGKRQETQETRETAGM